jgi:hypothetical protein
MGCADLGGQAVGDGREGLGGGHDPGRLQGLARDLAAAERDELVAALVHHGAALEALVALPAQAPDPVLAHLAESGAREPLGLVLMAVDEVDLAPAAGTAPVDTPVLARARKPCNTNAVRTGAGT